MMSGKHAKARASLVVVSLLVLLLRGPGFRIEVSSFGAQVEDPMHIPGNRAKTHNEALVPDKVDGTEVGEQHATAGINTTPTELIVNATAQLPPTLSVGESALVNITVSAENSSVVWSCEVGKPTQKTCMCGERQCQQDTICIDYKPEERGDTYCEPVGSSKKKSAWKTEIYDKRLTPVDIWTMNKEIQKGKFTMFDGHVAFFTLWSHFGQIPRGFLPVAFVKTVKDMWRSWDKRKERDPNDPETFRDWYGPDTMSKPNDYIDSAELVRLQDADWEKHNVYDVRKAIMNSFLDLGYWKAVKKLLAEKADANFDVLVAILDPLWDDKDDEEALRSIANALEVGLIDFAYIYITGPACEARARLTLAIFGNVLKQTANQKKVRIRWLPLYKCNTAAGKCSDTYNGVKYTTFGFGGERMGYKCPSVCAHDIDNQLDKVLHKEWAKLIQDIPTDGFGAHGPVEIGWNGRKWVNWNLFGGDDHPFMCDGEEANPAAVKWFQNDLTDAIAKLKQLKQKQDQHVKISVLSAAPLTGAAELLKALYNLKEQGAVTLRAVNFMGGFFAIDRAAEHGELEVGGKAFVLDGCSNWLFDVGGTVKVMNVLKDKYREIEVNFLPSFPLMKLTGNDEYAAYIDAFLKKQEKTPKLKEIKEVATLFKIERSMFTTARQGVNYAGDAIDMPNRCSWPIRLTKAGTVGSSEFQRLLSKINLADFDKCMKLKLLLSKEDLKEIKDAYQLENIKNAYFPVGKLVEKKWQVLSWKPTPNEGVEFGGVELTKQDTLSFLVPARDLSDMELGEHAYDYYVHIPDGYTKAQLQKNIHPLMHKWATKVVTKLVQALEADPPPPIKDLFAENSKFDTEIKFLLK